MTRTSFALVLLIALANASCAASPSSLPVPALGGRQFLSLSVTDKGVERPLVPGTRIAIGFAEGRLSASVGCNTMGADYRMNGDRLILGQGAVTEIGCDQPRHDQDEWLFSFLGSGPTLRLEANDLTLTSGETLIRLVDREVAEPDLPLVGPTWTVVSVISGETVSSVPQGVIASLAFQADGQVHLATGCNEGSARVTVGSGTLRFDDIVVTKRACPGPEGQMEAAVVAVLGAGTVDYRIEARLLSLQAGESGLQLEGR